MRRALRVSALTGLIMLLAACASDVERASKLAGEAAAYLEAGDYFRARRAAFAAVQARDDIAANWVLLGRIQIMSGRAGDAFNAYRRALELDPGNIEALQMSSEIALQAGRTRDAARLADTLLALRPGMPRPKLIKGFVALQENDLAEADRLANEILAADPGDEIGLVLKARVLGRQGKLKDAEATLKAVIADSPSEVTLSTLAEVYRKAGDGPKLAETLVQLNQKAPTNDRVLDLAGVYYKLGNTAAARTALFDWLAKRPRDEFLAARATNLLIDRDPTVFDATRVNEIATKGELPIRELAAKVLLEQRRAADAQRVLEGVMGPGADTDIQALYATARAGLGAEREAGTIIDRVLGRDEENSIARLLRARFALARKDYSAALADAQLVRRDDPESVEAWLLIARAYRERGDDFAVRRTFEEAVQNLQQNVRIARAYTQFLNETGDRTRAMEVAEAFTRLNPASVAGWDLLAQQCRDGFCAGRAGQGRKLALVTYGLEDASALAKSGLFSQL